MTGRRIFIQVASLVDMLLVVMFLNYLALEDSTSQDVLRSRLRALQKILAAQEKEAKSKSTAEAAIRLRQDREKELLGKNKTIEELRKEIDRLRQELERTQEIQKTERQEAQEERHRLGAAMKEILNIPDEAIERLLRQIPADERVKVQRQIEDLRGKSIGVVLQHLQKFESMRSRCDFWEVQLGDDDSVTFRMGEESFPKFYPQNEDEFVSKIEELVMKRCPTLKPVVFLVVLSCNEHEGTRLDAWRGVKRLVETLPGKAYLTNSKDAKFVPSRMDCLESGQKPQKEGLK